MKCHLWFDSGLLIMALMQQCRRYESPEKVTIKNIEWVSEFISQDMNTIITDCWLKYKKNKKWYILEQNCLSSLISTTSTTELIF